MTRVIVERHNPWFRKPYWTATFSNGKRTFIQGYGLYDVIKFNTLSDLLEYTREGNILDVSPGGGYGVGVEVMLDNMIIGEYYLKYPTGEKVDRTYPIKKNS